MNTTGLADETVLRHIVQNVTEHLQEDEKDSFLLAYALLALIICLLLSYKSSQFYNYVAYGFPIAMTGFLLWLCIC